MGNIREMNQQDNPAIHALLMTEMLGMTKTAGA
jgi:hypothetical protein